MLASLYNKFQQFLPDYAKRKINIALEKNYRKSFRRGLRNKARLKCVFVTIVVFIIVTIGVIVFRALGHGSALIHSNKDK